MSWTMLDESGRCAIHDVLDLSASGLDALKEMKEPSNVIPKDYGVDSVRIDANLGELQENGAELGNQSDSDEFQMMELY